MAGAQDMLTTRAPLSPCVSSMEQTLLGHSGVGSWPMEIRMQRGRRDGSALDGRIDEMLALFQ